MRTVLDTTLLPEAERAQAWAQTAALAEVTTRFRFTEPGRSGVRIGATALGPVQLSSISYAPLSSYRSARLIRRSDPESYQLAFVASGRQRIEQGGNGGCAGPGEILLYDSSRPFEASVDNALASSSCLLLQFPRDLMPLRDNTVAAQCGKTLRTPGLGQVLGSMLLATADSDEHLDEADRVRLGETLIDLAAAVVARHAGQDGVPSHSRAAVLHQEALVHIRRHLADPELAPHDIAAALSVSTRTLHRAFESRGESVTGVLRRERIARCRADLADPRLAALPVAAIGARWGLPRPAGFSRVFRAETATTPTDFRRQSTIGRRSPDGGPRQD
ncbi:AraC-like DNA-binding protein [Kitasatospora sp. SolWspMP-SS2h]|uniref:AraC-like ligand-binding domain-containing protein n=1 Tax=Kitasatospora sp. SolWspMP-SS2h TaxID=1305729 RepID=UPI000DB9B19D|nr:helix-turn-helix domain-containing protein [Kitasatospora sp. SolWspMP-SS2h]RAJ38332.1 AraC-like DNA-binding protein [Kitasatospora sp. SolWspMP-SS2h]